MASAWIAPTKIRPPEPPSDLLPRDVLGGAPLPPACILEGGPGDGKTLALWGLWRRGLAAGALALWVAFDDQDADPVVAFQLLIAAARLHVPAFGPTLEAVTATSPEPRAWWGRFLAEAEAYGTEVRLALDDVHHLAGSAVLEGLAYHLDKLPAGVHVMIATRQRLPLPLGRLRARGHVREVGPEALRFDAATSEAYMARRAGGPPPQAWRRAAERLGGWPQGLALVAAVPADGRADAADDLRGFLVEELCAAMPPERQAFLGRVMCLSDPTVEACAAAADVPTATARAMLEALAAEHVAQRLAGGAAYRFPAHVRTLLAEASAPDEPAWRQRVAAAYMAAGRPEDALPHLVAARAWAEAVAACEIAFPELARRRHHAAIGRWLEAFPGDVVAAEPVLMLWRAHRLARSGVPGEAISYYERARRAYLVRGDERGALAATVRLATLALVRGELEVFRREAAQALAHLAAGRSEDVADLHLARALLAEQRGDLALVAECNEAVLALPDDGSAELAACRVLAHLNLHTLAGHRGDLPAARAHAVAARAIARERGDLATEGYAATLEAHVDLTEGEPDAAAARLARLPAGWEEALPWSQAAVAAIVRAQLHEVHGAWAEAEACCREARAVFEAAGYAEGTKLVRERQAWIAIGRRQFARALALTAPEGGDGVWDVALAIARGRASHLAGEPAAGAAILVTAAARAAALGAGLHEARARRFAAEAEASAGLSPPAAAPGAGPTPGASAPAGVPRLEIKAFGRLEVHRDGELLVAWPRRNAKLVLAAMLLAGNGVGLEGLAELRGEALDRAVAKAVHSDISALRRALELAPIARGASPYVRLSDDRYTLGWEHVARFDVHEFDADCALALAQRESAPFEAAERAWQALSRYRGDLFADPGMAHAFEAAREHYRRRALELALWLGEHHRAVGDRRLADDAFERAIAIAPTDEEAYLALMRHHLAVGRPERVRQAYWDARKSLKARIGLSPSDAFEDAARALAGAAGAPRPIRR